MTACVKDAKPTAPRIAADNAVYLQITKRKRCTEREPGTCELVMIREFPCNRVFVDLVPSEYQGGVAGNLARKRGVATAASKPRCLS